MRQVPFLTRLDARAKLRIKAAMPGWVLSRVRPNAIRTVRGPARSTHPTGIPIFGLVCTWREEDIVYASVRHAFEQGVDRVYLIDNGSPDSTVDEAIAAGATHVLTFYTERFDEPLKYQFVNLEIERISQDSGFDRVWWLMIDADEFTSAPHGQALPDFVAATDARCRVVGARVFDHYPTPGMRYEPRTDPLAVQAMCREKTDHRCMIGHHKHPLFLWTKRRRPIDVDPGFHQLTCRGEPLYEPPQSLILRHFPFRNEDATRQRLALLTQRGATEESRKADADLHMRARLESLDAVYRGDYSRVVDYRSGRPGVVLRDWRDFQGIPRASPAQTTARGSESPSPEDTRSRW
jgi:hypothetical protein